MYKKFILFDLDGTLTDPKEGITKSAKYALESFGVSVPSLDSLTPMIGPPLRDSFRNFYGFSPENAEKAVVKYREYFSETGIFENELYPGMDELLKKLCENGAVLALATSKATVYAERILKHFLIDNYISFVSGSELDGRRSDKSELIQYALDNLGASAADSVMVGDREFDILGAKACGVATIGVSYGYADEGELENAGAGRICASVEELSALLLN